MGTNRGNNMINDSRIGGSKVLLPPIGVKPYWFTMNKRIKELSDAISRYMEFLCCNLHAISDSRKEEYFKLIKGWNQEINLLLNDYEMMDKEFPFIIPKELEEDK